ncbi:hypothetical protein Patl1_31671 [Pistacia atlantica]|uniref:Uncharacterized protein n=1 Tax=Pistacia atlantica TaxID=434234 RepID=A0ACC1APD6_9ROSI|nr:hypothetical protein Patl1_31671 [Pistacia atlantica]
MLTGRRPTDDMFREGLSLHSFVKMSAPDQVADIVDSTILEEALQVPRLQRHIATNLARQDSRDSSLVVETRAPVLRRISKRKKADQRCHRGIARNPKIASGFQVISSLDMSTTISML